MAAVWLACETVDTKGFWQMKIGIITFWRVANYGAMLQAYALWKYLAARGHEVVFIAHSRVAPKRLPLWRCFVSRRLEGVRVKLKVFVRHSMTAFAADFPQTRFCRTYEDVREATEDCDAFIVGSDQMWNPLWCSGFYLPLVMLDFADQGKLRIAYAASFGTREWREDQDAARAGAFLRKFDKISVREESGVALVKELSGRTDAQCLLDPTLLQTADFYREIMARQQGTHPEGDSPYIFRYMLEEWDDATSSQKAFEIVRSCVGISRVEMDRIPVSGVLGPLYRLLDVTAKIPVADWLWKIAYADFVFTNSFHGTVFAILFHRPFVSLLLRGKMSGMNERSLSLLAKLGLPERAVYAEEPERIKAIVNQPIQWETVEENLRKLRCQADAFFAFP